MQSLFEFKSKLVSLPSAGSQHNRFPNLKANLCLCLLLDRSNSLIFMCKYYISNLILIIFQKLPPILVGYILIYYSQLYCVNCYVINYSLKVSTILYFDNEHIAFIIVIFACLRPPGNQLLLCVASVVSNRYICCCCCCCCCYQVNLATRGREGHQQGVSILC